MHPLAESLLKTVRKHESLRPGDRVAAAVSGGADSVALMFLLLELRSDLGIVLSVAHVNHKLRGDESNGDQRFVEGLAQKHGLEFHVREAPVVKKSEGEAVPVATSGIEAAARALRYDFFRQLARNARVTKIATAHTLDDQAETVLLRVFRGTGIRGLAAIHPRIVFEEDGRVFGEVLRPLLDIRRAALLDFLKERNQNWREDSSNRNPAFLRNRVRHRLLPLIRAEFGEPALQHMAELAEIARAEDDHWYAAHPEIGAPLMTPGSHPSDSLDVSFLIALPLAAQRRLMQAWLEAHAPNSTISFRLIEDALDLAHRSAGDKLELPGGLILRRGRHDLLLESASSLASTDSTPSASKDKNKDTDYEYALPVPGVARIAELNVEIEASVVDMAEIPEPDRAELLDPQKIPFQLLIRNWRAGDRYWPAHTAAPKKVKELLSERHATGAPKKLWPVAVSESCGLVWMRGFPVPAAFLAPAGAPQGVIIREKKVE